jgi:hypothetical protein
MKTSLITKTLGVLALLGSSAGMAATVTITPSNGPGGSPGIYNVGDTFTLTITANVPNTFAATMGLSFDATKVAYVSGVALAPWNVFVKNSPVTANPTVFDVETPSATAANPAVYNVAQLTFQAIAKGAANIVINDDGGDNTGWFDATTADYIPNTYTQANVQVIPVPAAAWLFVSALGGLATLKRRGLTA